MPIHRTLDMLLGDRLFEADLPIYVNRAVETFDLHEHRHDFVELTYVSEGEGVHYIDETSVEVARGDIFFIPVGTGHVFRPRSTRRDRKLVVYNCTFRSTLLEDFLRHYSLKPDMLQLFSGNEAGWLRLRDRDGEFHGLFERLYFEYTLRRPGYAAALQAGLLQLLIFLYRAWLETPAPPEMLIHSDLCDLLIHVRTNCGRPIPVAEAAARLGLGERQFQRVFKSQTGVSFTEYVQNCRIDRCCSQLCATNEKIASIAAAAGYHDLKFFGRVFKKKTGVTPRQYRSDARLSGETVHPPRSG